MYAANHGITLHVVSDELSSRGQDHRHRRRRRRAMTTKGSEPPKARIAIARHRGVMTPKRALPSTYVHLVDAG